MRPLVIGPEEKAMMRALRQRAEQDDPLDMTAIVQQITTPAGQRHHMQRMKRLTIDLGFGFTVTYSVENHHGTVVRHLSMAVDAPERYPSPAAVREILPYFGFVGRMETDMHIAKEKLANPGYWAIQIIQRFVPHS